MHNFELTDAQCQEIVKALKKRRQYLRGGLRRVGNDNRELTEKLILVESVLVVMDDLRRARASGEPPSLDDGPEIE